MGDIRNQTPEEREKFIEMIKDKPTTVASFMGFTGKAAEELQALEKKIGEGIRVSTNDVSLAFLECYVRLHKEKLDAAPTEVDYGRCVRIEGIEYGIWDRMAEAPELTRHYLAEIHKQFDAAHTEFQKSMGYAGYVLGSFLRELMDRRREAPRYLARIEELKALVAEKAAPQDNKALFDGLNELSDADEGDA